MSGREKTARLTEEELELVERVSESALGDSNVPNGLAIRIACEEFLGE